MSVMTEFLDFGFAKMKKKVLYDKYISVDALFEWRSYERSLIILFFSPTFLEYASLAESESGVFILLFVTVRKRNKNIQLRCQGFSPPRRERPLHGGEKPRGRHLKIIYTF